MTEAPERPATSENPRVVLPLGGRKLAAGASTGRRFSWSWGLAAIMIPYLYGFSVTIYTAVRLLAGQNATLGLSRESGLALVGACTVVGVLVALVLTRSVLRLSWTDLGVSVRHGHWFRSGLLLFCAAYFLMWVAFLVFGSLPRLGEPAVPAEPAPSALYVVTYAVLAGVGEELLIVAVPVAVMTALRLRWPVQLLVLVVLRTPFHLYYGYTAVLLAAVWSVGYWLLYRRYRWIWPLVAAHTLYDCVTHASVFGAGGLVLRLVGVVVLLVGAAAVLRQIVVDRKHGSGARAGGLL